MKKNAKLLNTTNKSFKSYINDDGYLEYSDDKMKVYFYTRPSKYFSFGTTKILEFKRDNNILELQTINSKYIFEVDEDVPNPSIKYLSDCQKTVIDYMKNVKSDCFGCSSFSFSINSQVVGFVMFENEITRDEALEILANNSLTDIQGNLVENIYQAGTPGEKILDLKIYDKQYICLDDIENIEFKKCLEKFLYGKQCVVMDNKEYIYIHDFKDFLNI
jgi:hypothetical protein